MTSGAVDPGSGPLTVRLVGWETGGGFDHTTDDHRILEASAASADPRRFRLVDRSSDADLILFVGSRDALHLDVVSHPAAKRHARRCFLFSPADWPFPLLPGLYPSLRARDVRPGWCRPSAYLRGLDSPFIEASEMEARALRLFSFVGAADTHPVRRDVMALDPSDALLVDTTRAPGRGYGCSQEVYDRYAREYAEALASSRFVICPRGAGPSTIRIFEAMRASRVPVIVSDDWAPPSGPDWSSFSMRVAESEIGTIPDRLAARLADAPQMGRRARAAWERWFGPERAFSTFAGECARLAEGRASRERRERRRTLRALLRPRPLRFAVLSRIARGRARDLATVLRWGWAG